MRLEELFEPQVPTRKSKATESVPEVFILESLELNDEADERREGAVLAPVLKMCGKTPLYYYIRTKAELEFMAKEFTKSGYRYGGLTSLATTLDSVSYQEFAEIFAGRLDNRRLSVSACSAGNKRFGEIVGGRNVDLISFTAPARDIRFDHAVAFWGSFYVKTFSMNSESMNFRRIAEVLQPLATLFGEPIQFSRKHKGKWIHNVIDVKGRS